MNTNANTVAKKVVLAFKDTNANNMNTISSNRSTLKKIASSMVQTEAAGDKENITASKYSSATTNETATLLKPIETKIVTHANDVVAVVGKICKSNELKRAADDDKITQDQDEDGGGGGGGGGGDDDDDEHDDNDRCRIANNRSEPTAASASDIESVRIALTADDLTSDEPTSNYWKALAHKRADALRQALKENHYLRKKIESSEQETRPEKERYLMKKIQLLQNENNVLKEALSQATKAIEIFKEMLAEDENVDEPLEITRNTVNDAANTSEANIRIDSTYKAEDNAFGDDSTVSSSDNEFSGNENTTSA